MISFAEFEVALLGLMRLARFDAAFAGFFDLSPQGARRSFRLALWLLPIFLFLSHLNASWPEDTDMVRVVAAELIGYALMWICFPLLLVSFAGIIERENRIHGAIAVYNWLSVLALGLLTPIWIARYFGLDIIWAANLSDIVVLFVSACVFFAFRRLLEIHIGVVIALVIADYALSRMLELLTYGLARGVAF